MSRFRPAAGGTVSAYRCPPRSRPDPLGRQSQANSGTRRLLLIDSAEHEAGGLLLERGSVLGSRANGLLLRTVAVAGTALLAVLTAAADVVLAGVAAPTAAGGAMCTALSDLVLPWVGTSLMTSSAASSASGTLAFRVPSRATAAPGAGNPGPPQQRGPPRPTCSRLPSTGFAELPRGRAGQVVVKTSGTSCDLLSMTELTCGWGR